MALPLPEMLDCRWPCLPRYRPERLFLRGARKCPDHRPSYSPGVRSSETLQQVRTEFFQKAGPTALRAIAAALVLGAITFVVAHQGWKVTIESGVLLALVVAFATYVGILTLSVRRLESMSSELQHTVEIQNQRIGAHLSIAAWVNNCEVSLATEGYGGSGLTHDQLVMQELASLETSAANSLGYPFYSPALIDRIHELPSDDGGRSEQERLDELLAYLKKQLEAGAYLR
jgi:hypothetical protein